MEVEEITKNSGMIDSQHSSLSYLTNRKSVLNQQKLICFVIVSSDWKNTIPEKNTSYIHKSVQFICFFYIYTTVYSSYYPFESFYLIIDLDSIFCTIVEFMSFLLYYPFYIFMHYSFAYKYFSVMLRVNCNNISPDLSISISLL